MFGDPCCACLRVGSDLSESFEVNVGLKEGVLISLWLLNVSGRRS